MGVNADRFLWQVSHDLAQYSPRKKIPRSTAYQATIDDDDDDDVCVADDDDNDVRS